LIRSRNDGVAAARVIRQLSWIILAFALMAKVLFAIKLTHYGFVLAMPATLLLVVALVSWVPDWIARRGGDGRLFRAAALGAWTAMMIAIVMTGRQFLAQRTNPVATGPNRILAGPHGPIINEALAELEERVGPDQTMAVLPEGVMLNFLAVRANSTPFISFMPTELAIFGEDCMVEAFQANPPDFVLLVGKDTSEFGYRFFGRDYARHLYEWITENYREVKLVGQPPFQDDRFGIRIMQRDG
jgi:hypothetical protein